MMIKYRQVITISHDEPHAKEYRESLLENGWSLKSEDTVSATYESAVWCTRKYIDKTVQNYEIKNNLCTIKNIRRENE